MPRRRPPKLAVWKFASCDGCQLSLLDCEDELLVLGRVVQIAHFTEASRRSIRGPYDLSLVEGSITTPRDAARIREIRRSSKRLVTIGACATAGGIQALKNFRDADELVRMVYAEPRYIDTLETSTPISAHVPVDFEVWGCPVDKRQLLGVIAAMIRGEKPSLPTHSVCVECKLAGNVCVLVAHGTPCLGPVTRTGCGALCPRYGRGCYGCFGPAETTNTGSLATALGRTGAPPDQVARLYSTFNATTDAFEHARERELVRLHVLPDDGSHG